ncbi:protein rep [Microbacterium kribbense]|uniref:protein rep n=1 Tax=Microbacterium kribbense TaxID=433645 RepID=UPI0031E1661F
MGGKSCRSALCALCSGRRARRQRRELIAALRASRPRYALLWTYTLASTPDAALGPLIGNLAELHAAVNASGWLSSKVDGYARVVEIERPDSGWHPHGHELFIFKKHLSRAEAQTFAVALRDRYLSAAARLGIPASAAGQHVRVVPLDQLDVAARYITKQHITTGPKAGTRTLAMLSADAFTRGDADALALIHEAEAATYRRQLWRVSGACKSPVLFNASRRT